MTQKFGVGARGLLGRSSLVFRWAKNTEEERKAGIEIMREYYFFVPSKAIDGRREHIPIVPRLPSDSLSFFPSRKLSRSLALSFLEPNGNSTAATVGSVRGIIYSMRSFYHLKEE